MNWWEIPQNCQCLFALDSDSVIEEYGSKIRLHNTPDNWLKTEGSVEGRVRPSNTFGFYTDSSMKNKVNMDFYKSLKINKINLNFNTPISTGNNCTWFLKCVVKSPSVFSQGVSTVTHGLALDPMATANSSNNYSKNWYVNSALPGKDSGIPTLSARTIDTNTIHTVIVTNSTINQQIYFKTDYASSRTAESSSYFTSLFGSTHNVVKIGYDNSTWHPDVEIIAYGLFNGIIAEEDLNLINSEIDSQFKLENIDINFNTNLDYSEEIRTINTNVNLKKYSINADYLSVEKPKANFTLNTTPPNNSINSTQTLYKDFEHINDVVLEEGLPVSIKLFLYERTTGELIKTTISDVKGFFSFNNLDENLEYFVTANDPKYQFQSVIKNYNN